MRWLALGNFREKLAREIVIKAGRIPYTIVRATQFLEFVGAIAQSGTEEQTVRLSPAMFQPIASDDVVDAMANAALGAPLNGMAGAERVGLAALVQRYLASIGDPRTVVANANATYFGVQLDDRSLTADGKARLGPIDLETWFARRDHSLNRKSRPEGPLCDFGCDDSNFRPGSAVPLRDHRMQLVGLDIVLTVGRDARRPLSPSGAFLAASAKVKFQGRAVDRQEKQPQAAMGRK